MPSKFQPLDLTDQKNAEWNVQHDIGHAFVPILGQDECHFKPVDFFNASLNVLRNPNITSTHLFRADILYDSEGVVAADSSYPGIEIADRNTADDLCNIPSFATFTTSRALIRRLIPRNPQLDKPLEQSCYFLQSDLGKGRKRILVIYVPHAASSEAIPWYHPAVRALAYLYDWRPDLEEVRGPGDLADRTLETSGTGTGTLTLYYQLFSEQSLPLPNRLQRTAHHLISTIYKHGQGQMSGYVKKFHHNLLIPQARVQDTYTALKKKHAKRLCDNWVEVTDPSKHVFEDLSIAAFLIELWRDMYREPEGACQGLPSPPPGNRELPPFPGFVDIGCGNGVLTEILLCENYPGWGFDARRRKTWSVLSPRTKKRLGNLILVPQPLLSSQPVKLPEHGTIPPLTGETSSKPSILGLARSAMAAILPPAQPAVSDPLATPDSSALQNDQSKWHNGLFPAGTFIISNHADELTAWTPLLAALSRSPFLAIPCCSHNLSGGRFRAPSAYTGFTADAAAPQYFAREKMAPKSKHVAIQIPLSAESTENYGEEPGTGANKGAAESGDLKALSQSSRARQPSAYSSLCDWVAFLADEIGYEVEKDMLRIPSTRNVGIVCRAWRDGRAMNERQNAESVDGETGREIDPERWSLLQRMLERENPDGGAWIKRARNLMAGKDDGKTVHDQSNSFV